MFGLININKPVGWTSREAVNYVARLVGRKVKVGHAGTLDPLATGVLVVCVGPATRLEPWIHDHLKSYDATFLLGRRSDSDDLEGNVEEVEITQPITAVDLERALPEFIGQIQQVPPVYSALKIGGKRAYDLARAGTAVELPPREVLVTRLNVTSFAFPEFHLEMECGTGTYVRSIGRDLARRVGTEAVMSRLVRTKIGAFEVADGIEPEQLTKENIREHIQSPLTLLAHLPKWPVTPEEYQRLVWGQKLPCPASLQIDEGQHVSAVNDHGELAAIAALEDGKLAPQIVFKKP
ncbi:tRNA pseudouridine(55) synthase TruB [Planctomicrobium piriforme]|uniref:tRNA pseudouridine synthase B n=1 Tax=Planctomicrobium piriforme TaxID=1576369 RepID=A0A1I3D677_9PLAN|nr:tRNA pseudouridine(55) synthase TruB [Planctomicrobium piriforme]SFH82250.1 tRNA pseudouridine55 synthase [Planctomicrobium piriforme]